ncbi:MAG: hypothetical protein Q4C96_09715 [Planctomycetia bacterium]|nr:hypothetical protein [Planctomycetia bacterium]
MLDILSLYIALTPLAIYLLVMGLVNFSRHPFVISGVRDLGVLFMALTGFIIIGPMELFFPVNASWHFGPFIWLFLLAIYGLTVTLILLAQRSRIHIYNISLMDLRPVLSDLVMEMDPGARWAGDALVIPKMDVQLYLETSPNLKNVSLVATKKEQNLNSWRILENSLKRNLQYFTAPHKPYIGITFFSAGLLLLITLHALVWIHQEAFFISLRDMLRI